MIRKIAALVLALLGAAAPIRAIEGLQAGMDAPAVSLADLDSKPVSLSDFGGSKLIVLAFFATWNDRSADLLERLERLHQRYRADGLAVLGIDVESLRIPPEEEAAVRKMVRELGVTFPVLVDRGLETFRSYGVVAVPTTVLVDAQGKIAGDLSGYPLAMREEFFDRVEALLTGKERPSAAQSTGYRANPRAIRYFNLAKALAARGAVDMADSDLKKSIEIDPGFILPVILQAQILAERAQTDEAVEFQGKTYTTAFFTQEERRRYLDEAALLLQKALELEPGNPTALTEQAAVLDLRGRVQEAEGMLRKAIAAHPAYTPAHYRLGALLLGKGDARGARQELEVSKGLNPLDYKVYFAFARAYEEKGMVREAVDLYKKCLDLLWPSRKELFPLSFGR